MQSTGAMKVALLALSLALISVQCARGTNVGQKINDHLLLTVTDEEPDANLVEARNWLSQLDASKLAPIMQRSLIEHLRRFVALATTEQEVTRCTEDSYAVLALNELMARQVADRNKDGRPAVNRVAPIVRHYRLQHALACKDIYPAKVAAKLEQFDSSVFERLKHFSEMLVNQFLKPRVLGEQKILSMGELVDFKLSMNSLTGSDSVQQALGALRRIARDDPDAKCLEKKFDQRTPASKAADGEQLRALFSKYIGEPCWALVETLAGVCLPAKYDAKLTRLTSPDSHFLGQREFYQAWQTFNTCQLVVSDKGDELVQRMVSLLLDV